MIACQSVQELLAKFGSVPSSMSSVSSTLFFMWYRPNFLLYYCSSLEAIYLPTFSFLANGRMILLSVSNSYILFCKKSLILGCWIADLRPSPFVENMVTIYKRMDAAFRSSLSWNASIGKLTRNIHLKVFCLEHPCSCRACISYYLTFLHFLCDKVLRAFLITV